jgi:hypothetical protein
MTDARSVAGSHPPGAEEARLSIGLRLDSIDGAKAGKVEGVFVDAGSGEPRWLAVKLGRFGRHTAIPFESAATAGDRVWTPYGRDVIRAAPEIDPAADLGCARELELGAHFEIPAGTRRLAELEDARFDEVTAVPLAG